MWMLIVEQIVFLDTLQEMFAWFDSNWPFVNLIGCIIVAILIYIWLKLKRKKK